MKEWQGLEKSETSELIRIFQNKKKDESLRDRAFITLCFKFRRKLLDITEKACDGFGHSVSVAEMIVDIAFTNYCDKPSYTLTKQNSIDTDKGFLFYLSKIAKNELTNYYRIEKRKKDGSYFEGNEEVITELPILPTEQLSVEYQIKIKAIESLPGHLKTTYLTYECYEKAGYRLSHNLLKKLRLKLGVSSQNTVRGYKRLANITIDNYLEAMELTVSIVKKNEQNGRSI